MIEITWPFIAWATGIIFLAGGAWFELHRLRKDFSELKPTIAKVPVLEVRVEKCEEGIKILQGDARVV
jgi:hypothetical protein